MAARLYGAPDDPTPVVAGSTVTLTFESETQAVGNAGCNSFGGSYDIDGETITFGPIERTEMACLDDAIMTQENAYFDALESATRYEVSGDELTIAYSDGQQLTFSRMDAMPSPEATEEATAAS